MFRTYYIILFMLFLACSKQDSPCMVMLEDCGELPVRQFNRIDTGEIVGLEECDCIAWSFDLGDGQFLTDTPGLRSMALSGSHRLLMKELNGTIGKRIPAGLEDDPEGDEYADQVQYGDYIVAMYHPITYPDHFITYNWKNGVWIRWELNNGNPLIFRQS